MGLVPVTAVNVQRSYTRPVFNITVAERCPVVDDAENAGLYHGSRGGLDRACVVGVDRDHVYAVRVVDALPVVHLFHNGLFQIFVVECGRQHHRTHLFHNRGKDRNAEITRRSVTENHLASDCGLIRLRTLGEHTGEGCDTGVCPAHEGCEVIRLIHRLSGQRQTGHGVIFGQQVDNARGIALIN